MDFLYSIIDVFIHLDEYLHDLITGYGNWIYVILFLIIFVETGLVVFPFLPGDSLLFAAGTFCAGFTNANGDVASLNLWLVLGSLFIAAVIGDASNYFIGKEFGLKAMKWKIRGKQLIPQKNLEKTQDFFEKHGPKTIIIARFVPIVRTFAPFVAGIGEMTYARFLHFNIIGAFLWVFSITLLGYFFGNIDIVKDNFEIVVFGIIGISLVPMIIEIVRSKMKSSKE